MRTLLLACLALNAVAAPPPPLPLSTPEKEGFSSERLERLDRAMDAFVHDGKHTGVSILVARNGHVVDWKAWGLRDLEAKLPMEKDTPCRIYSMTKVITSVAALALYEEGRFALTDPVEKYIPELKGMQVLESGSANDPKLVPAKSPITIKQLMTHTSGLIYPGGDRPAGQIWERAKLFAEPYPATLRDWVVKVHGLPLAFQPGEKWEYGVNNDVLGYLVEVLSGIPFDKFVDQRVLEPLKMHDSHFFLPEEKMSRAAKIYELKDGKQETRSYPGFKFGAGGMGLWSTPGDYARFAQMILNGGQLDGVRVLSRKTVELMTANHLNHMPRQTTAFSESEGWGLAGSVRLDLAKGNSLGSVGEFGWAGAASTWFRIDPKEKLVMVIFQQRFPNDSPTGQWFSNLVYQAIAD